MNPNRAPHLPPDLDARLRAEPDAAELARVWDLLDDATPSHDTSDVDEDWQRLRAATLDCTASEDTPRRSAVRAADRPPARRPRRSRARWIASGLALVLAVAGWLYLSTPMTVTAPAGSFAMVQLPDGSTVELNSGSQLEYNRAFWRLPFIEADQRTVRLVGEAYFEVESAERPFVVQTAEAQVRVLGTMFNVRARDAATTVTVTEGRVRVEGAAEAVELGAGERARVIDGVTTSDAAGVANALAWRERGFAAQEQSLAAIFAELERRYAVDITLTTPDAADDTLTLYFSQPTDAEAILRDICTARDLNYRRTSRGYEVY
jgi:ferric-dicitrate binding protein FerR (iron transport regulator)